MASEVDALEDTAWEESTDLDSEEDWEESTDLDSEEDESLGDNVYTAAAYGDLEKLRRLVEAEARPVTDPDGGGYYALQWAALNNRVEAARYILQHGANVNSVDHSGQTALHWSAVRGNIQVAGLLLTQGAKVDAPDLFGYQVTHVAAQYGQTAFIYYITAKWNADPDALDHCGRSPLHWAAYKGFPDSLRLLLFLDAYRLQRDILGCTPVHYAAREGKLEACSVLVHAGKKEDLIVKDNASLTPAELAADMDIKLFLVVARIFDAECVFNKVLRSLSSTVDILDKGYRGMINVIKFPKSGLSPFVWLIAIGLLTTYINSVIPGHMTAPFALFAWSGAFHAIAGLVMFIKCSRKDPGYIKTDTRDTQYHNDDEPLLCDPELLSGNWSQICIPCKMVRPIGSKHCYKCERCVEQFHCHGPLLPNCIGKRNKWEYFMFVTLEVLAMIITGSAAYIKILRDPDSPASFGAWLSYSAANHSGVAVFLAIDSFFFSLAAPKIARNVRAYLRGFRYGFRNHFDIQLRQKFTDMPNRIGENVLRHEHIPCTLMRKWD